MRQHFYNFAHRVLPRDVHTEGALWTIISDDRAASYLQTRWNDAAQGTEAHPPKGLIWIQPIQLGDAIVRVVRMPVPEGPSEAYYAAIARTADGTLRYFVAERSATGGAFLAEWRPDMRVRCGDLAERATSSARPLLRNGSAESAPWEVSFDALPGLPYLAAFLNAVGEEVSSAAANAMVKAKATPRPQASAKTPIALIVACAAIAFVCILAVGAVALTR